MIKNMRQLYSWMFMVRNFGISAMCRHQNRSKGNSGLNRRLQMISEAEPDIEKADINLQSIEELEEDIMQADGLHDEIVSEMEATSKKQQFKIIQRKYFRPPKEPGMLTWSEKEQMKSLHQSDPEKWNPETLADSFPATPDIIKKILRTNWKPTTAERLKDHDQRVSDNWVAFHRGQLKMHDPLLKAHLSKFSGRQHGVKIISDEEAAKITEVVFPKPKRTEFLSLLTGFNSVNENETKTDSTSTTTTKALEAISKPAIEDKSKNALSVIEKSEAHYTLEQFRTRLKEEVDKITETPQDIKFIIGKKPVMENETPTERYVAPSESFKIDAVVHQKRKRSPLELRDSRDNIPNRIQIPQDVWKPGLVYRVNDCFYNDKGYFLYRVPGLKI